MRSPDELLRLEPKGYDVVFNLLTHSVYHVSEHMSDLLAACSGNLTLEELVNRLVISRNLAVDHSAYLTIKETFDDLARKRVVDMIGYHVAV